MNIITIIGLIIVAIICTILFILLIQSYKKIEILTKEKINARQSADFHIKQLQSKQQTPDILDNINLTNAEKITIIIFNKDGTTECGYYNMDLQDKALVRHEIELDIIDEFLRNNKGRWKNER